MAMGVMPSSAQDLNGVSPPFTHFGARQRTDVTSSSSALPDYVTTVIITSTMTPFATTLPVPLASSEKTREGVTVGLSICGVVVLALLAVLYIQRRRLQSLKGEYHRMKDATDQK